MIGKHLIMSELTQLYENMSFDLQQPINCIPYGLLWGIVLLPVIFLCEKLIHRNQKPDWKRLVVWFCCIVYVYVMLNTAFFNREPGSRMKIDLQLFGTWTDELSRNRFMFENIIMFLPFGILFPCVILPLRKVWWCVVVGCLCSTGIELIQLLTQRGFCQLDDVVANTAGAFLGWVICRVFLLRWSSKVH